MSDFIKKVLTQITFVEDNINKLKNEKLKKDEVFQTFIRIISSQNVLIAGIVNELVKLKEKINGDKP